MSDFFAFLTGLFIWISILVHSYISPCNLKTRLHELWYSTGQQAEIMSWLVK